MISLSVIVTPVTISLPVPFEATAPVATVFAVPKVVFVAVRLVPNVTLEALNAVPRVVSEPLYLLLVN